jgi:hypothetical protein
VTKVYNSPPNWPRPPEGWMPEPGWQPDPSWGPAPTGWQFWIDLPDKGAGAEMATPSTARADELRIFLSYRRSDCQPQANGLYDGLRNRLPAARVFMDIDGIPPGTDFEEYIRREISACDIVLVMIGDNWLDARPGSDVRRIDEPADFVRLEIESALASPQVLTLPVLVENAPMPSAAELPGSIARLARLQAFALSDLRWRADLDGLVAAVEEIGRERGKAGHAPLPRATTETAHVLLADPGHAGSERTQPVDEPRQMPGALVWMPLYTFGLGAFVPALWAGLKRPAGDRTRERLFAVAVLLAIAAVAGFVMVGASPEDETGTATGPWSDVGVALMFVVMMAGVAVAFIFRKPSGRS